MNTLSEKIRTIFLTCHYFNIKIIICSKPERIHIQVSKHWISNAIDTHFTRELFCLTPVTRSQCARGHVLIVKLSQFLEKSLNVKTCGRCNVTKYHYWCMLFFLNSYHCGTKTCAVRQNMIVYWRQLSQNEAGVKVILEQGRWLQIINQTLDSLTETAECLVNVMIPFLKSKISWSQLHED